MTNSVFWKDQPLETDTGVNEPIIKDELVLKNLRNEPYSLPVPLQWVDLDPYNDTDMNDLACLLNNHYMIDDDGEFSILYSKSLLKWYLTTPSQDDNKNNVVIGIKLKDKLVGSITGVNYNTSVYGICRDMIDVNLFCIHNKLRKKGLAQIMIQEITRRANQQNVFQATFSGSRDIPKYLNIVKFYHRPLNVEKLLSTGFLSAENCSTSYLKDLFRLDKQTELSLEIAKLSDAEQCCSLLNRYLKKHNLHYNLSYEQFKHMFFNEHILFYVVKHDDDIIDMISFLKMFNRVIKDDKKQDYVNIAQIFYYTCLNTKLETLINDACKLINLRNFDVVNVLDDGDCNNIVKSSKLKLTTGTGELKHYLFNWKTSPINKKNTAKHII